jgi:Tannase-like family of unknown function (DUF6351)
MSMRIHAGLAIALALATSGVAADSREELKIEAVSNRADLVSGGDVLLRVTLPRKSSGAVLSLNGVPIAGALHAAPDGNGYLALVSGLVLGQNTVTVAAGPHKAHLTVTNHPIGGPIFSGPHLQPWLCTTAANGLAAPLDADCNAPTVFRFFYKNTATPPAFVAYDPANPPPAAQVAVTTTDHGRTVPYIVRQETGTLNRTIYRINVLFDPSKAWTPWAPQQGWNGKVLYLFGAGAGLQHTQGSIGGNAFDDNSLSRGFATAAAVMTNHGTNANTKLNAEALMMVKEHLAETYGPIRYTMGSGCSGGAIQQHSIGDQYPGLLDGLLPVCSYPDTWSLAVNSHDCHVLTRYFNSTSPSLWTNAADRIAILGQSSEQECPGQDGPAAFGGRWFPVTNTSCLLPATVPGDPLTQYNPLTNPHGVRCSINSYHINEIGTRPQDGFTYQVFDSVGVQYGLKALEAGRITPEQFVDLNEKIGGLDIDGNYQVGRTVGDLTGIERMYHSGLITYGRQLGDYPIIDARTDDNHEMHNNSEWMFTRFRILRANGSAANQVHWWENSNVVNPQGNVSRPSAATALRSFNLLDQWLTAIEADQSSLPHAKKVTRNKPAAARDACIVDGVEYDWTPGSVCDQRFTFLGMIRVTAGGPVTNDVLKCQLKPLSRVDYAVGFTDAQWARLQATFPSGVCDYTLHGVGQTKPKPWLTFADGPGGRRLGKPPVSHPGESHGRRDPEHDDGDDDD